MGSDRPATPAPFFVRDIIGKRIYIPDYDVATIGGKPVYRWSDSPHVWMHSPKPEAQR